MRELNAAELAFVSGGEELVVLPTDGTQDGGAANPPDVPDDIYNGVVFFAAHAVEPGIGGL